MRRHHTVLIVASLLLVWACGGKSGLPFSLSSPTSPESPPPSEEGSGTVAGAWAGTYAPEPIECGTGTGPARATFEEVGSEVSGTLSASPPDCGFTDIRFTGTLEGVRLHGTFSNFFPNAWAQGTVKDDELELAIFNVYSYQQGLFTMRRQ